MAQVKWDFLTEAQSCTRLEPSEKSNWRWRLTPPPPLSSLSSGAWQAGRHHLGPRAVQLRGRGGLAGGFEPAHQRLSLLRVVPSSTSVLIQYISAHPVHQCHPVNQGPPRASYLARDVSGNALYQAGVGKPLARLYGSVAGEPPPVQPRLLREWVGWGGMWWGGARLARKTVSRGSH